MFYRPLLAHAWRLAWRHKNWWILGFFATFLGISGGYRIIVGTMRQFSAPMQWWQGIAAFTKSTSLQEYLNGLAAIMQTDAASAQRFFLTIGLFLLLLVLMVVVTLFAEIGLFVNVRQALGGGAQGVIIGLSLARRHFGQVLMVTFILQAILWGGLLAVGLPLMALVGAQPAWWHVVLFVALFTLFTLFGFFIAWWMIYSVAFVVFEDLDWKGALAQSWPLVWRHWLVNLELSVILLVITVLATIALLIIGALIAIPLLILSFLFVQAGFTVGVGTLLVVGLMTLILFTTVAAGAMTTFQFTAWVLLFLRLLEGGLEPKLVRMTERHILGMRLS